MVPKTDAALAEWSTNFQVRGSAALELFQLSPAEMAQYTVLHESFMTAYHRVKAKGTRTQAEVIAKEEARIALLRYARALYGRIQSSPSVSDQDKALIGVHVRGPATARVAPPGDAPLLAVVSVRGRRVEYRLNDATAPSARRRPPAAWGAIIQTYVGEDPPSVGDPRWRVVRQTGKTAYLLDFPETVGAGEACWVTARWYSRRGEYSPAATPVRTYLQVGPLREAA